MSKTGRVHIQRVESGQIVESADDVVVVEQPVSIVVDGTPRIETTCSPGELGEWVIGYLFSEGWIVSPDDVDEIRHDGGEYRVRLHAGAHLRDVAAVRSDFVMGIGRIQDVSADVTRQAAIFEATGGTHAAAIVNEKGILAFVEDISRTCALEKAIGEAVLMGVDFSETLLFLSSRVPSRAVVKAARCGIPIVAAVSAPTADAVRHADDLNICLCGFVRGDRLNVYAHGWRLGL